MSKLKNAIAFCVIAGISAFCAGGCGGSDSSIPGNSEAVWLTLKEALYFLVPANQPFRPSI